MCYFYICRRCHLRRALAVLPLAVALFLLSGASVSTTAAFQSQISLLGIPGPYSFHRFCRLATDELWVVGGNGTVQRADKTGTNKRQITDRSLNGVYFVTTNIGWVVGDNGTILRTKDRGSNWEPQSSSATNDVQAITCINESSCWAVGNDGLILRTIDQGGHWTLVKSGTSAILFAASFVNSRLGWVVGEKGLILHTRDAGESWEEQRAIIPLFPDGPFARPTDLQAVKFIDENRGWIAGTGGVARTLDGGKTWEVKQLGNAALIGLVTNDGEVVWAISSEGRNYLSNDRGMTWTRVQSK